MKIFKLDYLKILLRSVLVFFIFMYSAYLQYIPIIIFKMDIEKVKNNYNLIALLSLFSGVCISFILFVIYRKDLAKEFKIFKKKLIDNIDTGLACWVIGLVIMVASNLILSYVFKADGANNEKVVQTYIKMSPIYMALDVCLVAPFNEEIVFRKAFKDVFLNKYLFVIMSFLIFGGVHVIGSATSITDYLYIVPYGIVGAMFAVAYSKTDTVFTSMTFHIIHNTALFLISVLL